MNPLTRLRAACVVGTVLVLAAGCTSNSEDSASELPARPPNLASPSVVDPETLARENPATEEQVRAAIEAQWVKFWLIYRDIVRTPNQERDAILSEVVDSPLKEEILIAAQQLEADGIDNYGTVIHRVSWEAPVAGKTVAEISDCQDASHTGSVDVRTGTVLTKGEAQVRFRGKMIKGTNDIWRLQVLYSDAVDGC